MSKNSGPFLSEISFILVTTEVIKILTQTIPFWNQDKISDLYKIIKVSPNFFKLCIPLQLLFNWKETYCIDWRTNKFTYIRQYQHFSSLNFPVLINVNVFSMFTVEYCHPGDGSDPGQCHAPCHHPRCHRLKVYHQQYVLMSELELLTLVLILDSNSVISVIRSV